jgi:CheY-like chemotaxis protein
MRPTASRPSSGLSRTAPSTARRIRAAESGCAHRLHLVALTANAGREDEIAARAAGFDGFLAKPLNLKLLPPLLERQSARAA